MKITVLGCGNAFSEHNFNQSFLLEEEHEGETRKMAIDCGYQFQASLIHAGISVQEIDDIYISHLHADHIGCLEYVAFNRYDWRKMPRPHRAIDFTYCKAPRLFCERNLIVELWEKSLRGGLESMEGFQAKLETYFDTVAVDPSEGAKWQGWQIDLVQQVHIMTGSTISLSFGALFSKPGHRTVYFTTDSQHCSPNQVEVFYDRADWIFQDCEISPFLSNVHANYIQLAGYDDANARKLSKDVRAKMKLSHYQDFYNSGKKQVVKNSPYSFYRAPDSIEDFASMIDFDWDACAKNDGFDEFIKVGNEYCTKLG